MEKTDESILFPEVDVCGYRFRPWTLDQAVELAPTLGSIVEIIEQSGISKALSDILDAVDIDESGMKAVVNAFRVVWKDVVRALPGLAPKFLPLAPKILMVSLGQPKEVVGAFDLNKTRRLLTAVAMQNWDYLKNYYGPAAEDQKIAS